MTCPDFIKKKENERKNENVIVCVFSIGGKEGGARHHPGGGSVRHGGGEPCAAEDQEDSEGTPGQDLRHALGSWIHVNTQAWSLQTHVHTYTHVHTHTLETPVHSHVQTFNEFSQKTPEDERASSRYLQVNAISLERFRPIFFLLTRKLERSCVKEVHKDSFLLTL